MEPVIEKPIDLKGAAEFMGLHYKTVYNMISAGRFTCFHRLGGKYIFFKSELTQYLKSK
jgi:excisionase family DNA binding protein